VSIASPSDDSEERARARAERRLRAKVRLAQLALKAVRPIYRSWPRRHLPEPPPCPDGWVTGPPDFVIVGAQKAGTTWWHRLVTAHRGVRRANGAPKEIHYFDRFWSSPFSDADAEAYHRFFPRPPGLATGECTPEYMYHPWTAPYLKQAAPRARLIALLRDPVERYRSALTWELWRGAPRHAIVPVDAMRRGFYHEQLRRLLAHFDREQLLVLQFEQCVAEPVRELERTYRFLGLEPTDHLPSVLTRPTNVTEAEKLALPDALRDELVQAFAEDGRRLAEDFPEIDLSLWPNFRHLA
jgi:hypothetical protein